MYEMAIVARKARLFMLVIGFCMLLFSGLPSAGEMEGTEAPGLDPDTIGAIKAVSDNLKLTAPQEIVRDFMDGKSLTRVIVNLCKPAKADRLHNFKEMVVRKELKQSVYDVQNQVISNLDDSQVRLTNRFIYIFGFSAEVTLQGLQALIDNADVLSIEKDEILHANLAQGIPLMNASTPRISYSGSGLSVAICDTGIDYTHPRLGGGGFPNSKVIGGHDCGDNDNNPMDDNGHGTHTAGTVAAGDNGFGVVGVVPLANLYALKVLGPNGSGSFSSVIAALDWSVDHGIQVTSNSYGSSQNPGSTVQAAFDNAAAAGIINVASAGNSGNRKGKGDNVGYPANYGSVIAVAATDSNDKRASFSSTGSAVEESAPGVSVRSTLLGGGYGTKSGTSMAAPHVAGLAALIIAAGSGDVRTQLRNTADDLGATGWDPLYGYGLVNAVAAAPVAIGNQAPIADAGPAQNVETGSLVQLDGTGSFDPDSGDSISYSWTITSQPSSGVSLSDVNAATPTFTPNVDGVYIVELTVTDDDLSSDTDSVTITATTAGVNNAPKIGRASCRERV